MNEKVCPKCNTPMNLMDILVGLPRYTREGARAVNDKTPAISVSDVLTAELYFCPNCRFLEMYGA